MNELGRGVAVKTTEKQESKPQEKINPQAELKDVPVTEVEVQQAVKKYAEQQGAAGRRTVEATLTGKPVAFTNNTITVFIENEAQKLIFDDIKQEFLDAIRASLKNNSLQLEMQENDEVTVKKAYTSNEKFAAMVAKNPLLLELRKRLDLTVE